MKNSSLKLNIDTRKTVLSSQSLFFKTEHFIKETKYINGVDYLLSKLCEGILINLNEIIEKEKIEKDDVGCFLINIQDLDFSCQFKFGYQIGGDLNKFDLVFFDCLCGDNKGRLTINEYVKSVNVLEIEITKEKDLVNAKEFNKLYLISNTSNVNLPRLSKEQRDIVETVDKNVLVQGVAGSGKTNICIDKIIFTACKNYKGKVLYTTYSRGLLNDTKLKVESYKKDLIAILESYKNNSIVFLDKDHRKALENRLGIYFFSDDDCEIFEKIERVIYYLTNKVDYYLIEDIYKLKFNDDIQFVREDYFINVYSKNLTNYQIEKCFNKLANYSKEIIYKEIYGMIFGYYELSKKIDIMPKEQYVLSRNGSFSKETCENIYQIALDYYRHCDNKKLLDNNSASRKILTKITAPFEYSLSIIDEVQDYTQINLYLFKKLSLKLFCVGDALQMINPSYFSFGYLKNLLYEKDLTDVKELKNNYRNTVKIANIIDSLGDVNRAEFGTHNFVLKGESIDSGIKSTAIYINDNNFANQIARSNFDNFTFVVSSLKKKKDLQKIIKNQEVLTVSEIKGLERQTIVAYNILSDNSDKWASLARQKVNRKEADENSVYRYYYNLFYVGLSRARQNIFVVENLNIKQFEKFFKQNFEILNSHDAIEKLSKIVSKVEFNEAEILERINEFIKLQQYDNARFTATKINDDKIRIDYIRTIEINESLIKFGKYREAGIKFWEYGLIDEAKKQFILSNDYMLIELMESCVRNNSDNLNVDIINYFEDLKDNSFARQFILDTIKKDVISLKNDFNNIKENFKRGGVNGKRH